MTQGSAAWFVNGTTAVRLAIVDVESDRVLADRWYPLADVFPTREEAMVRCRENAKVAK